MYTCSVGSAYVGAGAAYRCVHLYGRVCLYIWDLKHGNC